MSAIGYAYDVYVSSSDGSVRSVNTETTFINHLQTKDLIPVNDSNNYIAKTSNPLVPWTWRSFSLHIGEIGPNDVILISGAPTINDCADVALKSKYALQMKNCQFLPGTKCEKRDRNEIEPIATFTERPNYSSSNASSAAFALHNNIKLMLL